MPPKRSRKKLTVLSTVLLVATLSMWLRAQFACDAVRYYHFRESADSARVRGFEVRVHTDVFEVCFCKEFVMVVGGDPATASANDSFLGWHAWSIPPMRGWSGNDTVAPQRGGSVLGFTFWIGGYTWSPSSQFNCAMFGGRVYRLVGEEWTWGTVPWWFLALLFAILPFRAVRRSWKARRRLPHQCPRCRYDCRATADADGPLLAKCPECGTATGRT